MKTALPAAKTPGFSHREDVNVLHSIAHQKDHVEASLLLDPYLSLRTLTSYSGLSRRTIQNYLRDPFYPLPHFLIKGKILVRRSEFDEWLEHYRNRTGSKLDTTINSMLQRVTVTPKVKTS